MYKQLIVISISVLMFAIAWHTTNAQSKPLPPANVQADAVSSQEIVVSWVDTNTSATDYYVERAVADSQDWMTYALPAGTMLFNDTWVVCGMSYDYRVKAYDRTTWQYSDYSPTVRVDSRPCVLSELLYNGSMEIDQDHDARPDGWTIRNLTGKDKLVSNRPSDSQRSEKILAFDGRSAFKFNAAQGSTKKLNQTIRQPGQAGDTFTASAWIEAKRLSEDAKVQIVVTLKYTDGSKGKFRLQAANGTYEYSPLSMVINAEQDYTKIKVQVSFKSTRGKAHVDSLSLLREE